MDFIQRYLCLIMFTISSLQHTQANSGPLLEMLAKRNVYKVRPVLNEDTVTDVKIEVVPRRILHVSEINQEIKVHFWARFEWRDEFFQWDPAEHNGTEIIFVQRELMWTPDIVLYQSNTFEMAIPQSQTIPLTVTSDGSVKLLVPRIYVTHCKMNLLRYPFDTQTCTLKFSSWVQDGHSINLVPRTTALESTSYLFNGEWDLVSLTIKRNVLYYSCCPAPFPDVDFTIGISRRPWFYVLNLIVPFFILTLLSAFVFFIPPESGEKVSLAVTTLLSLVVFTQLVLATIPPASDGTSPIVGIYFVASVVFVSAVVVFAVFSLNAYHRKDSGEPVRKAIRFVVFTLMGNFCFKLRFLSRRNMKTENAQGRRRRNPSATTRTGEAAEANNDGTPKKMRKSGDRVYASKSEENRRPVDGLFFVNSALDTSNEGTLSLDRATVEGRRWPSTTESVSSLIRMETLPEGTGAIQDGGLLGEGVNTDFSAEWVEVSRILDRFFLVIFMAMFCLMPVLLALQLSFLN